MVSSPGCAAQWGGTTIHTTTGRHVGIDRPLDEVAASIPQFVQTLSPRALTPIQLALAAAGAPVVPKTLRPNLPGDRWPVGVFEMTMEAHGLSNCTRYYVRTDATGRTIVNITSVTAYEVGDTDLVAAAVGALEDLFDAGEWGAALATAIDRSLETGGAHLG